MNVLFLTTHLNTGGISQYIFTLAKGLHQQGHKVFVGSSGGDRVESLTEAGIYHVPFNIRTKSELDPRIYTSLRGVIQLIKKERIDIIHSQTRITQVMGTLLSRLIEIPHVTTCHGFFKTRLSRKMFPCWGDAVIAISDPVKKHLQDDFSLSEEKVTLIPNGIDLNDFSLCRQDIRDQKRRALGLGKEPVIGIIARLSDVKGHDILIQAIKQVQERVPGIVLLIVGQGREESNLRSLVNSLNLQSTVKFLPLVNQTAEMLSVFDIFVMPSLQEGLGLSVMEAQAARLPVIASNVGGIPSLIKDGQTGLLVEPGDADDLAQAMIKLLEDRNHAQELGARAQEFVKSNFSAEKMVEATVGLYKKVVSRK